MKNIPEKSKLSKSLSASEAEKKNEEFEIALVALEKRIGYTFKNRDLLRQALTGSSFANLLYGEHQIRSADNRVLESTGDVILEKKVRQWIDRLQKKGGASSVAPLTLSDWLNSNLYLSAIGMKLGLAQVVRHDINRARAQSPESQIRLTADVMEALMSAIRIDGSDRTLDSFVDTFILPEPSSNSFLQDILDVTSDNVSRIKDGLMRLTRGEVHVNTRDATNGFFAWVTDDESSTAATGSYPEDAMRRAIIVYFSKHPWRLWGLDGPASLHVPQAHTTSYGGTIEDQSNQTPTLKYEPPPQFREEDTWQTLVLPSVLPTSTAERGPYIDKLRLHPRFEGRLLEVRMFASKNEHPRFAFYVDGKYEKTVDGRRTLNDAASEVLRSLDRDGL